MPCIYNAHEHQLIVNEIVGTFAETVRLRVSAGDYHPRGMWQDFAAPLVFGRLRIVGPLIKDSGFHVEKEWRLVYSENTTGTQTAVHRINFRPTALGLVPYLNFRIREKAEATMDEIRVTVGPSLESAASMAAIEEFLKHLGVVGTVECSTIPFRIA